MTTGIEETAMTMQTLTEATPVAPSLGFPDLQQRLASSLAETDEPRHVVVLPSRTIENPAEPPTQSQALEERLLCSLLELRDPQVRMTYVTSSPVSEPIVGYYLSLLPRRMRARARARLTLVALGESTPRPLSEKLLERPAILERIRRAIGEPRRCHLAPYTTSELEREVALELQIPMYGADPEHARFGTKSGCRALFAQAGVAHPLGAEDLGSEGDVVAAIVRLRAARPALDRVVVKLNEGVAGRGNAVVELGGVPAPGSAGEAAAVTRRVASLRPDAPDVGVPRFLAKLAAIGGIVEEWITGEELRSPSVQLQITPAGEARIVSTHDQILGGTTGQSYLGCRFPAAPEYAAVISSEAQKVGDELAGAGVIGRFAMDFVVVREASGGWRPYAIEVNLRKGGTTHPYETLASLTGGSYDPGHGCFQAPAGRCKHYVATDHLEVPELRELGRAGVLALARHPDLRFEPIMRTGIVFHMLSSVDELGRMGLTAIGDSADEATARFAQAERTLLAAARAAAGRPQGLAAAA